MDLNVTKLLLILGGLSALFLQGTVLALLKTEGELQQKIKKLSYILSITLLALWIGAGIGAKFLSPNLLKNYDTLPTLLMPFLTLIAVAAVPHYVFRDGYGKAFIAGLGVIVTMILTFWIGMV